MSEDVFFIELNRVLARVIGVITAVVLFIILTRMFIGVRESEITYDIYDFGKELIRLAVSTSVE